LFDLRKVREDFPILERSAHGKPLAYFDNAATTQKPQAVIDAVRRFYERSNANIHRAVHLLSGLATQQYEEARAKVQRFLNAAASREIIFVRGATEALNLVAQTFGRANVRAGDEIIISHMEHHSNIVPWQMLCEEKGARLRAVPVNDRGEFCFKAYEQLLTSRTRLVSVVHVSNAMGTINPVRHIVEAAHRHGIPVLLDGAQAVSHLKVDVQALDCDFYALSGHKLYGPTGVGVLYGKAGLLEEMPPWQGGGDMIRDVTLEKTSYAELPNKFEAGTPDIAGAVGLGAAIDYLVSVGLHNVAVHESTLLRYATQQLEQVPGIRLIGTAAEKVGVLSFIVTDPPISSLDVGTKLDLEGVAVRTGHHCCQPLMERLGIPGTVRASFAMYNTLEEIDRFVAALRKIVAEAAARARPAVTVREPVYPRAFAASPTAAADKLASAFEFLEDWSERYQQIIDLGRKLPPLPAEMKTEANRVHGCQSTVYLSARKRPGTEDVLEFLADSDADIVSGLIALLQRVFSGQPARAILAFDVEGFFSRLGLNQHLSMTRRNGLAAMVQRIRGLAVALVADRATSASECALCGSRSSVDGDKQPSADAQLAGPGLCGATDLL
jgi:cysteine desulfurase/selenocysteine lyase